MGSSQKSGNATIHTGAANGEFRRSRLCILLYRDHSTISQPTSRSFSSTHGRI